MDFNKVNEANKACLLYTSNVYKRQDKKEITDRHSHNSIFVIEMPRERNGFKPKVCAAYYGRTERLEEADEKFYRLCKWYNCIGTCLLYTSRCV